MELKDSGYAPQIVTDDYSIQNVATKMGIEFLSLATLGINDFWSGYVTAQLASKSMRLTLNSKNA